MTRREISIRIATALLATALIGAAQPLPASDDPNAADRAAAPTTQTVAEQRTEADARHQVAEHAKQVADHELEAARQKQAAAEAAISNPLTPSPTAEQKAAIDLGVDVAQRRALTAELQAEYARKLDERLNHRLQVTQRTETLQAQTTPEALAKLTPAERAALRADFSAATEETRRQADRLFEAGEQTADAVTDLLGEQQALLLARDAAMGDAPRNAYFEALDALERQLDKQRLIGYEIVLKGRNTSRLADEYAAAVARLDAFENRFWQRNAWLLQVGWIVLAAAAATVGVDLLGWLISRAIGLAVRAWRPGRALPTVKRTETLVQFARSILKLVIWVAATVTALEQFGIQPGQTAGALGVIGLVLMGMFQHLVIDFVKGIDIALGGHYFVGDFIQVGDKAGHVLDFTVKYTVLRTPAGQVVVMPNSQCVPSRRFPAGYVDNYVDIPLAADADVGAAREKLRQISRMLNAQIEALKQAPTIVAEFRLADRTLLRVLLRVLPASEWVAAERFIPLVRQEFAAAGLALAGEPQTIHINDVPTFRRLFSRQLDDRVIAETKAREQQPTLARRDDAAATDANPNPSRK